MKKDYKESTRFINFLEKTSQKEPPEIYTALGITRQRYSLLKLGQVKITNDALKEYSRKISKLGISEKSYKQICCDLVSSIVSS